MTSNFWRSSEVPANRGNLNQGCPFRGILSTTEDQSVEAKKIINLEEDQRKEMIKAAQESALPFNKTKKPKA